MSTAALQNGGLEGLRGLELQPLDQAVRETASIPDGVTGLFVKSLDEESPFSDVLRPGVVIVEVNRKPVKTINDFRNNLQRGVNHLYVWYRGNYGYIAVRLEDTE